MLHKCNGQRDKRKREREEELEMRSDSIVQQSQWDSHITHEIPPLMVLILLLFVLRDPQCAQKRSENRIGSGTTKDNDVVLLF